MPCPSHGVLGTASVELQQDIYSSRGCDRGVLLAHYFSHCT